MDINDNIIVGGDPVLIVSFAIVIILVITMGIFFMKNYYVVYIESRLDEKRIESDPDSKTYLLIDTKSTPIYEGPSSTTMKIVDLQAKGKLLVADKYDLGYYHIRQFNGWVSRKSVSKIKDKEKDKYEQVLSVNHNRHKFAIYIINSEAKVYVSPSVTSRLKYTLTDTRCLLDINHKYLTNRYHDNWYYIEEVHGWIHEEYIQSKTLY